MSRVDCLFDAQAQVWIETKCQRKRTYDSQVMTKSAAPSVVAVRMPLPVTPLSSISTSLSLLACHHLTAICRGSPSI